MSYDPTLFNVDPYYDDFNEDKKFLRIMFKPGYALQAREVTQMQTMLQNQIERFGSNIFENGSIVLDGQITENYLRYGRITGLSGVSDVTGLVGAVVGAVGSAQARIIHAEAGLSSSTVDAFDLIYFDYIGGGTGFTHNTTISGTAGTNSVAFSLTGNSTASVIGDSTVISVNSGVRYVDGYFVMHDAQMIGAYEVTGSAGSEYRKFSNPTTRIGFATNPSFVTSSDDETLNDPAFGYYNYAAPGADRFKLDLTLTQYGFDPTAVTTTTNFARGNFMEIIRIVDGQTVKKELYPQYAAIEDTLARRTYDESGNYTVEPFDLNLTYRNNTGFTGGAAGATLSAELGAGKAYIFGHEFETQGTTVLSMPKARSTTQNANQFAIGSIGPSLPVTLGGETEGGNFIGFNITKQPKVYLSSSGAYYVMDGNTGPQGQTSAYDYVNIGTARIRNIIPSGANSEYDLYLYDIKLNEANTLSDIGSIFLDEGHTTPTFVSNWFDSGIFDNKNNTGLLYSLPRGDRIKSIDTVDYAISNFKLLTPSAGGSIVITSPASNVTFSAPIGAISNPSNELFVLNKDGMAAPFTAVVTSNKLQLTITIPQYDSGNPQDFYIFYVTNLSNISGGAYNRRTKTKSTYTSTSGFASTQTWVTDQETGKSFLYLKRQYTDIPCTDVINVLSITGTLWTSNGTTAGIANQQLLNYFTLDNGQRDNYYDYSRLIAASNVLPYNYATSNSLPPAGFVGVGGPFTYTFTRFIHGNATPGVTGPFTVDSYTIDGGIDYSDIPVYVSPSTGRSYRLSDVLDFRPSRADIRTSSGSATGNFEGSYVIPSPSVANLNKFTYTNYLSRTDKIVLGRDRDFKVLSGIPSNNPQPPVDSPDAMTLYNVTVNGYTTSKDDVQISRIENKRYTMQDIASLENRIDNVEYYSNLNILEQQARNSPFLDDVGIEIPKKGILVDGFRGHSVSDVQDPMYAASIDFENNEMRPSFQNRVYRLNQISNPSNITGSSDGIYTLDYQTSPLINQPLATSSLNVNPAGVFNYLGFMRATPSSDFWYDDTVSPIVRINTEGENDAWLFGNASGTGPGQAKGFGSQWNDWESNWLGVPKNVNTTSSINSDPTRSIFVSSSGSRLIQPSSNSSTLPYSLSNNTENLQIRSDVVPYARSIDIGLSASNLRPNTNLYLFVDGVSVSVGGLASDAAGNASVYFSIPSTSFVAGKKSIRLTSSPTNDLTTTTTAADYIFPVQGTWGNIKDGIITTRTVQSRRESVRSENIVTNVFGKDIQRSKFTQLRGFTDPLSQSFYIDPSIYPSGVFAKKITLYFKSKDSNANTPVSIVLRPIVNGYPHPSKFIPLSDTTILSSAITTSTNASVGTDFAFTSPVYLAPGEYAFSLVTPSNNFDIFTSQIGMDVLKQSTTESTVRATKQPYARSLFKNQTSTGVQKSDIEDVKFLLHICKFTSSANFNLGAAGSSYYGSGTSLPAHATHYNVPYIIPSNTQITNSETGLVGSNVELNKLVSTATKTFNGSTNNFTNLQLNLFTSDQYVSPVVDIDRANINIIENKINYVNLAQSGETGSTNLGAISSSRATARYITKRVVLEPGMQATNLRVEMLASYPSNTTFKVYARMASDDSTQSPFDLLGYTEMTPVTTYANTTANGYQEMSFRLMDQPKFKVFAIKIVMGLASAASDPTIVPRFKNLRITAA
jgi:hypothetical protein